MISIILLREIKPSRFPMNRFLVFVCALLLAGCVKPSSLKQEKWFQSDGTVKVLTTTAMIADIVAEIGGDQVDAHALIKGELDPHTYELVKGDDERFVRADLIFYNGLGLEHGLSLRESLDKHSRATAVTQKLLETKPETILIVEGQYDPHVWMDIAMWVDTIDPVVDALCAFDPEHAALYRSRGEALRIKMCEADREIYEMLQAVPPEKRYLVTSHDAFNYFTRHYLAAPGESNWQVRCKAPEGLAPEAQMSISDVIEVVSHAQNWGVEVLFPESNVSQDALKKIVDAGKKRGMTLRLSSHMLYGDAMGESESYLDMVEHNARVIAREFMAKNG